jgi:hypothetical protein
VRRRRLVLVVGGLVALALAGGYAALALTGGATPPPPRLAAGGPAARISGVLRPAAGSFAGYRVRSDQARRDAALGHRAIETQRYPRARFTLAGPVAISPRPRRATGALLLHGRRAPIAVTLRGRAPAHGRLELVGSAPIRFARFGIEPPSVAGLVTVSDHGLLEFRLVLTAGR